MRSLAKQDTGIVRYYCLLSRSPTISLCPQRVRSRGKSDYRQECAQSMPYEAAEVVVGICGMTGRWNGGRSARVLLDAEC